MPIYEVDCHKCKRAVDVVCKYEEREQQICEYCGKTMQMREGRSAPIVGKSRYQMQAVMPDGKHVKGHFGKAARTKKK
jgi:hypothetical protein